MAESTTVEISIKGKWMHVPALRVGDNFLIIKGRRVRTAVVEAEDWLEAEIGDPELCVRRLKETNSSGLRADIFTFAQKIPSTEPRYSYPMVREVYAVARVDNFQAWWTKLPQETRKNVRRAEKRGVTVCVKELNAELVNHLVDLNNDSPVRQGKQFTHFGKTFDQVMKDQMSYLDRSDYICAYSGEELIGVLKLVYRGDSASILTLISKPSHADKRPANALLAKAAELCEAKQVPYLIYGKMRYGNKRDSSLEEFKIRHGFEEMEMPRYYVPVNFRGAVCIKLGLHRGLIEVLPPRVIAFALAARAKFYQLLHK